MVEPLEIKLIVDASREGLGWVYKCEPQLGDTLALGPVRAVPVKELFASGADEVSYFGGIYKKVFDRASVMEIDYKNDYKAVRELIYRRQ